MSAIPPLATAAAAVAEKITAYLSVGGLFNPELADHDAVRDLLIEVRDQARAALAATPSAPETSPQE